jgi:hypothetical protein
MYFPAVGAAISKEPFSSVTPETELSSLASEIDTPLNGLPAGSDILPEIPGPSKAEAFALMNIEKNNVKKMVESSPRDTELLTIFFQS